MHVRKVPALLLLASVAWLFGPTLHAQEKLPPKDDIEVIEAEIAVTKELITLQKYVDQVSAAGYLVVVSAKTNGVTQLVLIRQALGAKEHGLFNVKWTERERRELIFFMSPDTNLMHFVSQNSVVETKAPFFGKWRPVDHPKTKELPPQLSPPRTLDPTYSP